MKPHSEQKVLWTIREAAEKLSLSARTVERLVSEGQLPSLKIGRSTRIPVDKLFIYLEEKVSCVHNNIHARRGVPKKLGGKSTCQSVSQMVCLNGETRNIGGSVTSMQAANELAEVLGLPTEKKPKRF